MNDLMLTPEQIIPFLVHDDPIVRDHARRYFQRTGNYGPLTADHYWDAVNHLPDAAEAIDYITTLDDLPQTDASLHRLVRALDGGPPELTEFHLQVAARNMQLDVLARNQEELLGCPHLLPLVKAHLELRLSLLNDSPATAWKRLMQHARELGDAYAYSFNASTSDALIEAAARGGDAVSRQAMTLLDDPAASCWREIFAVRALGLARHEPAIDRLVDRLTLDADLLRNEANSALVRIASPRVFDRIVEIYQTDVWHVRLFASGSLSAIKRPQSVATLLKLLEMEQAMEARTLDSDDEPLTDALLSALTELGSLSGLAASRQMIAKYEPQGEILDLIQCLLATSIMNGVVLPEAAEWRRLLKNHRQPRFTAGLSTTGRESRDSWRKTGISFPTDDRTIAPLAQPSFEQPAADLRSPSGEVVQPIRNTTPKIGRNDACPCGSGKKYKKCCGK